MVSISVGSAEAATSGRIHVGCRDTFPKHTRRGWACAPAVLGVLGSVAGCWFSSPGYFASWLAWVALVPIFLALRQTRSIWRGAGIGLGFGILSSLAVYWPFIEPVVRRAQWSGWIAAILVPALLMLAALPYGVAGACTAWFRRRNPLHWCLPTAIVWTLAPLAFLSVSLFASQYQSPVWLQGAALGGIYAVQFLLVLVNALWAGAIMHGRARRIAPACGMLAAAAGVMGLAAAFGSWQLARAAETSGDAARSIAVGWGQLGSAPDQPAAADPALAGGHFETALKTMADWSAQHPGIDLLVLPEMNATFAYEQDEAKRAALARVVRATRKPLMAHATVWARPAEYLGAPRMMSLSLCFDGEGRMLGNYAKRTLIPFVEYLPLETAFRSIRHLAPEAAPYAHGPVAVVFPITPEVRAVPMLCYESLFSGAVRDQVALGGNLLIEQANDSELGAGPGAAIHLALALFRPVEFGLPMVRATATGVSAGIDAQGRIMPGTRLEAGESGQRLARFSVPAQPSFYARHGHVFAWFLTALLGAFLTWELWSRGKSAAPRRAHS
jgi:apolipoprotein N-acyltransferase